MHILNLQSKNVGIQWQNESMQLFWRLAYLLYYIRCHAHIFIAHFFTRFHHGKPLHQL